MPDGRLPDRADLDRLLLGRRMVREHPGVRAAFPEALPLRSRAMAEVRPDSLNEEARTLDVIWTTGATVRRRDFWNDYVWDEELVVSPDAIDLTRFNGGSAPLLDQHRTWGGVGSSLGIVRKAWIDGSRGLATLQVTRAPDVEPVWQRILEGIIRSISVGYTIDAYELIRAAAGGVDLVRVTRWTPHELSFVTVPADAGATVRGAPTLFAARSINRAEAQAGGASQMPDVPAAPAVPETRNDPAPAAAPSADALRAARQEAIVAERARVTALTARANSVASQIELPDGFLAGHIERGSTVEEMGTAILDLLAARSAPKAGPTGPTAQVTRDNTDPVEVMAAMSDALAARATERLAGDRRIAMSERGRAYAYHGMLDMAADLARARGADIPRMVRGAQLFEALMGQRSLTTSDFPILLADVGNKILVPAYKLATPTYRKIFARKTFNDFKAHKFIRQGDFPVPLEVGETGEYQYGSMSETKQELTIGTYGRIMKLTRRILVNDDLGAFTDFPTKIARRIADWENAMCWAQLALNAGAGPAIAETSRNLFNTTDKTLASSSTVIDVANVGIGRAAMMNITSLDGLKLNITPRYLVTSPDKFTQAQQFANVGIVAVTDGTTNPFKGVLEVVADANLTGNAWYLFADPSDVENLVYGVLQGAEGPRIYTREGFTTDGVELKVSQDFVAGAIDYRGAYKNAGA